MAEPTTTWVAWTVTLLAAHIRGIVNADADAAGGTTPARIPTTIRAAAVELWTKRDWDFRRKLGSFVTSVAGQLYTAPTDFAEIDQRWIRNRDGTGNALRFTTDPVTFQEIADRYLSTDTGQPVIALTYWDTTTSLWKFQVSPIADAIYTYPYWYLTADPFTQPAATIGDTTALSWPKTFDEGWRRLATAMCLDLYGRNDEAQATLKGFKEWFADQVGERDEPASLPGEERIRDGYNDGAYLLRMTPWL
jgi:hypothetical protein